MYANHTPFDAPFNEKCYMDDYLIKYFKQDIINIIRDYGLLFVQMSE